MEIFTSTETNDVKLKQPWDWETSQNREIALNSLNSAQGYQKILRLYLMT